MIRGMEGREEEEGRGEVGNGELGDFFEGSPSFLTIYLHISINLCIFAG